MCRRLKTGFECFHWVNLGDGFFKIGHGETAPFLGFTDRLNHNSEAGVVNQLLWRQGWRHQLI